MILSMTLAAANLSVIFIASAACGAFFVFAIEWLHTLGVMTEYQVLPSSTPIAKRFRAPRWLLHRFHHHDEPRRCDFQKDCVRSLRLDRSSLQSGNAPGVSTNEMTADHIGACFISGALAISLWCGMPKLREFFLVSRAFDANQTIL
jgi:hypothetical protein